MRSAFNIFEKALLLLLIVSSSFLIIIQYLNYNNSSSINTSFFQEYNLSSYYDKPRDKGVIILKNMDDNYKDVSVLINGDYVSDFTKDDELEIYVHDNDMIEIDGTKHNNKIHIRIVGVSKNINNPKLDSVVVTSQSIEILGKVQLK